MEIQQKHIDYWRRRQRQQQAQSQQMARQARAAVEAIVQVLVSEFGAQQIILFGSLVRGGFALGSDIDLAVAGIRKDDYFAALAAANRLTPLWVDLKPLEDLDPHFRQRVLETGEFIYEADVG
ncbi:MAG: nucleotidyltransferase family protein [Hormoscilla sp.]